MSTFQTIAWTMRIIVVAVPAMGLCFHLFRKAAGPAFTKYYLGAVVLMELLNMTLLKGHLYLFAVAPLLHALFYLDTQRTFLKLSRPALFFIRTVALIVAVGLFPFATSVEHFQAYSTLLFNAVILWIALYFLYYNLRSQKLYALPRLYFNYACLLFFSIDLFMAISSNFLVNAPIQAVFTLWLVRFVSLLWYYYAVTRFAHG